MSSVTAFLNSDVMTPEGFGVDGRKLRVLSNSTALRATWNEEGTRINGVEFLYCGLPRTIKARKGVIVCAGIKSSIFLMHSGIGPRSLLEKYGIDVKVNNPNVGAGLRDQSGVVVTFAINPDDQPLMPSPNLFGSLAWLPAPDGDQDIREVRIATTKPIFLAPGVILAVIDLLQPRSSGRITINSSCPLDPPVLNPRVLSNNEDLELLVDAFQIYLKGINNAFKSIDPQYTLIFPDPSILNDRNKVREFIREEIHLTQHFQCHCRMAPREEGGVVDSSGRVYGAPGLIVGDNSAAPTTMDGSPMATGYLIAANIARILLNE